MQCSGLGSPFRQSGGLSVQEKQARGRHGKFWKALITAVMGTSAIRGSLLDSPGAYG